MNSDNKTPPTAFKVIATIAMLAFFYWLFFRGGDIKLAEPSMQQVENKVAEDAVAQYYISARQGDKMQTYSQATMAATAFLQAKDETNYRIWKAREDSLAKVVGLK